MLTVSVITMVALTIVMLASARNTLFPPVLFCATWTLILLGLLVAGRVLYPVSDYAYLVFTVGAIAFSVGGLLMLCLMPGLEAGTSYARGPTRFTRTALDLLLAILVVGFPFYLRIALRIADTSDGSLVFFAIRQQLVQLDENPFGPIAGNLNVLASLVAMAMYYETDGSWGRRWRVVTAALLAFAYSSLTGSKGGLLFLVILFFLAQIRARRLRIGQGLALFSVFLAMFAGMLMAVNLAGFSFEDASARASEVGTSAASYLLGAPISFGLIAEQPHALESSQDIGRFFVESARSLGFDAKPPNVYEHYTMVGPNISNNTYTIYFSYFKDYGWSGMVVLMMTLGTLLTCVWRRAMSGAPVAVLMYSIMCKGIIQSFYSENFYVALNGLIKSFVFFWLLYTLLPAIERETAQPVPA
jgi:oligosaccharide repeat unit polymerase